MYVLYHGGHWEGPPEIRHARTKRTEHGAGLYLTTSIQTARRYAKGGGNVVRFEVDENIVWLDESRISVAAIEQFVRSIPRLRHRDEIIADVRRHADRIGRTDVPAYVLVNLMVNYDAIKTKIGPQLVQFLVDNGIDALLEEKSSEDWVVLFNLRKIKHWEILRDSDAKSSDRIQRLRPR